MTCQESSLFINNHAIIIIIFGVPLSSLSFPFLESCYAPVAPHLDIYRNEHSNKSCHSIREHDCIICIPGPGKGL